MAFDATNNVAVGDPTRKSHFDQLLANTVYNKAQHEVGHNAASGKHLIADLDATTYIADGGTGDVRTIALDPAIIGYVPGLKLWALSGAANTGAVTVNVNGKGAKAMMYPSGTYTLHVKRIQDADQ